MEWKTGALFPVPGMKDHLLFTTTFDETYNLYKRLLVCTASNEIFGIVKISVPLENFV